VHENDGGRGQERERDREGKREREIESSAERERERGGKWEVGDETELMRLRLCCTCHKHSGQQ